MASARKSVAVIAVVLLAVTGIYYVVNNTNLLNGIGSVSATSYDMPSSISTTFSRNFSFSSSSLSGENFSFFFTLPVNDSSQQSLISVKHSSNVATSKLYVQNRTYVKAEVLPGRSYVNVSYNVTSRAVNFHHLENSNATPSMIPAQLKREYDHPEYFNSSSGNLEVINPSLFRNLTLNITRNDSTVASALRSIYDYIVQNYRYNITYNIGNIPLSAQQVHQLREGDCEELSYLFESMSRSIGIPSWTQYGLLIQSVGGQINLAQHAWVQTYIPTSYTSGTLVNIDLTVEVGGQDLGRGFFVKFPNSILEWTDDGNSSEMVSYHTELISPSTGLNVQESEVDRIYSYNQSGQIVIGQDNLFNLLMANIQREEL